MVISNVVDVGGNSSNNNINTSLTSATSSIAKSQGGVDVGGSYLSLRGVRELLHSIGERPDERTLRKLFSAADTSNDGKLHLEVSDGIM